MSQTKDESKRISIRNAVIADVVVNGLGNAPISRIAARAGVSVGTIYIYYSNKKDMLQSVYLEIKKLLHGVLMGVHRAATSSAEAIRSMWFAMLHFIVKNPDMYAFHEAICAEKLLNPDQREDVSIMANEIQGVLLSAVQDGTLKNMPIHCLISLLNGPLVSFARWALSNGSTQPKKDAEQIFQAVWKGIAVKDLNGINL